MTMNAAASQASFALTQWASKHQAIFISMREGRTSNMRNLVVLIVESEILIRMNIVTTAQELGYQVLEAANADDALNILEIRRDIGAVITDICMPGSMDGLKLAQAIKGRWPPIEIIVTSALDAAGHSDFPMLGQFIRKPYRNDQITAALQQVHSGPHCSHSDCVP
jgi:CheY-like chemotaxis protein